jgi:hypothetical protein
MLIDPVFDRTLPHREVAPIAGRERADWGTERFGILGERAQPVPGEVMRRHQSFSAYGLARDQQLVLIQEHDLERAEPRVIIGVRTAPTALNRSNGCW